MSGVTGFNRNPERTLVRITEDICKILGVDGRDYDLRAGDIVTLPSANAAPLLAKNGADDVEEQQLGGRNLESAGAGIGLFLVETAVTSYDGEIWVEENDPEGSVFVVKR